VNGETQLQEQNFAVALSVSLCLCGESFCFSW
jgi:hypothetical protein